MRLCLCVCACVLVHGRTYVRQTNVRLTDSGQTTTKIINTTPIVIILAGRLVLLGLPYMVLVFVRFALQCDVVH